MQRICETCSKPFQALAAEVKRGNARFCSLSCSANRPRKARTPNLLCAWCGNGIYRSPSKKKNSKSGLFFCDRTCKSSAQSDPSYGISPPHYGTGKTDYRKIAFDFFAHKCDLCGYDKFTSVLEVHHKDRDRTNNKQDNLQILCRNCHGEEHFSAR